MLISFRKLSVRNIYPHICCDIFPSAASKASTLLCVPPPPHTHTKICNISNNIYAGIATFLYETTGFKAKTLSKKTSGTCKAGVPPPSTLQKLQKHRPQLWFKGWILKRKRCRQSAQEHVYQGSPPPSTVHNVQKHRRNSILRGGY